MVRFLFAQSSNCIRRSLAHGYYRLATLYIFFFSAFSCLAEAQDLKDLPAPPAQIKKLLAKNVKVKFYSGRMPRGQIYQGQTNFHYQLSYRYTTVGRAVQTPQGRRTRVGVRFQQLVIDPQISISIPSSYANDRIWESDLMLHELEHVRIDNDARVIALLRKTVTGIKVLEMAGTPSRAAMDAEVEKAIAEKLTAVRKLVQANNDLFDKITRHGTRPVDLDPHFYLRLYQEDNLKEQGYPFLREVMPLLRSASYKKSAQATAVIDVAKTDN